jgi:hypothetical protein
MVRHDDLFRLTDFLRRNRCRGESNSCEKHERCWSGLPPRRGNALYPFPFHSSWPVV